MAWFGAAQAVTVHTWVDDDGVRHYADAPPARAASDTIELADLGPGADAGEDPYSILNQWQRLREERAAQDAVRLERERLRAAARSETAAVANETPVHYRAPGYPLYLPYGLPNGRARHFGRGGRADGYGHGVSARRRSVVHAPPPEWPRHRFFRR